MTCNPELVSAFVDGELEQIILQPVVTHLLKCDTCCQTMGWLVQVKDSVAGHYSHYSIGQDPEEMTRSIMGVIKNEKIYVGHKRLIDRLRRFGVPTAMLVALLAGSVSSDMPVEQSVQADDVEGAAEVYVTD